MNESNQNESSSSPEVSPETPAEQSSSPSHSLPALVEQFFKSVSQDGFPSSKSKPKKQPWKANYDGQQHTTDDGKLFIAVPKICTYGSSNLGGL